MRTNLNGVTEVAHIRTDMEKYGVEYERIFGPCKLKICGWCNDTGVYENEPCPRGCEAESE